MPMRSPIRGGHAARLAFVALALVLVRCDDDNQSGGIPTEPQRSGSLTVSIAATPTSGRTPLEVAFTSDVSGGGGRDSYVYAWSFGDGTASSEANPRIRFTNGGTYNVTLRVVSGSDSVVSAPITVRVDGDVRLSCFVEPEEGAAPHTVSFRGEASGGNGQVAYLWQFGDGTSAADRVADHVYSAPGTYLATLTATSGSASATCVDEIHVFGPLVPECRATRQGPLGVKFNVVPNYCFRVGCTYLWDFGDGASAGIERPLHVYGAPGSYTATATVKSAGATGTCSIGVNLN
jgi:PKD repeat protein